MVFERKKLKSLAALIVSILLVTVSIGVFWNETGLGSSNFALASEGSSNFEISDRDSDWGDSLEASFYVEDWFPGDDYTGWIAFKNAGDELIEEIEMVWERVEDDNGLSPKIRIDSIKYVSSDNLYDLTIEIKDSLNIEVLTLYDIFDKTINLQESLESLGGRTGLAPGNVDNLIMEFNFDSRAGNQFQASKVFADITFTATIPEDEEVEARRPRPTTKAEFELENLSIKPEVLNPDEEVSISVIVRNIGGRRGSYTVDLLIDNEIENSETVNLSRDEERITTFKSSRNLPGVYEVEIGDLTGTFTVSTPVSPILPDFGFLNLVIEPEVVRPGETVNISIEAINLGELDGEHTLGLNIDGILETSQLISLFAGESMIASFDTFRDTDGIYEVELGGLFGTFTVVSDEIAVPSTGFPIWLIIPLILIPLWLIILLLTRRKKRKTGASKIKKPMIGEVGNISDIRIEGADRKIGRD